MRSYNNFSHHFSHAIQAMLNEQHGRERLFSTLCYNFADVPLELIQELMPQLISYHHENYGKKPIDDEVYLKQIAAWYVNIDHTQKKHCMSSETFLDKKADKLANAIKKGLDTTSTSDTLYSNMEAYNLPPFSQYGFEKSNKHHNKNGKLLDIGTGDGNMSFLVGEKLGFTTTGVDVTQEGAIEWGGDSGNSCLSKITLVIYDGKNLRHALQQDTQNYTRLYSAIMFNHSLHHYPSFNSELEGLSQAISLLKEGGVLFLSEHANVLADHELHLQHILFDIKTGIDRALKINPNYDKHQLLIQTYQSITSYSERKDYEHYFSRPQLIKLITAMGLELVQTDVRTEGFDPSQTVFYCFRKPWKTLDNKVNVAVENQAIPQSDIQGFKKNIKSFDDNDMAEFCIKTQKTEHSISLNPKTVLTQQSYFNNSLFSHECTKARNIKHKQRYFEVLQEERIDDDSSIMIADISTLGAALETSVTPNELEIPRSQISIKTLTS